MKDKIFIWALVLACLVLGLQIAVYAAILLKGPSAGDGDRFDLIVVFGGDPARIELAIQECRKGLGSALVISDSGLDKLDSYFKEFGSPGTARILLEPYARTTDENARLVGRIIRREGFKRVLLISSWYHLPRAYLLLRLALVGSGVHPSIMATEALPSGWFEAPEFRLELAKGWGSLARWAKSILRKHGFIPGALPLPVD